jgi:RNA polymerase sigma-70 factor (ECF subfamily)
VTFDGDVDSAAAGRAVTLVLDHVVDISRGDMIVSATDEPLVTRTLQATVREVPERFVAALLGGDARAVEALLTESAVALTDGGGEFLAARRPVRGADKVARFYVGLTRWRLAATTQIELRHMNGLPAIVLHTGGGQDRLAPLVVTHLDLDRAGRVTAIHSVLASSKLTALRRAERPVQGIAPSGR